MRFRAFCVLRQAPESGPDVPNNESCKRLLPKPASPVPPDGGQNQWVPTHHDRAAAWAAWCAFVLGGASAVVSVYWAAAGSALLDTVGGSVERWGRHRSSTVLVRDLTPTGTRSR